MRKINFLEKSLIDKDLAYLLGSIKDGSLPIISNNKFEVTFACDFCRDWLSDVLTPKIKNVFGIDEQLIRIYECWSHKSKRPFFRLKVYSKNLYEYLTKFYPPGAQENWITPEIIKSSNSEIQKEYISGFYDAEGGCRDVERFLNKETKTLNCEIIIRCKHGKSPNEPLTFIKNFLEAFGIHVIMRKAEDGIMITGKSNTLSFYNSLNLQHPRKKLMLKRLLQYKKAFPSVEA